MTDVYVPSRVGEGYFTDWQTPIVGDNGKPWAWSHSLQKYVPTAFAVAADITAAINAHLAAGDPHPQYELESNNVASAILVKLLTVDTDGSGLNATTLQGNAPGAFAASSHAHSGADITSGEVADARIAASLSGKTLVTPTIASFTNAQHNHSNAAGGGTVSGGGGTPGGSDTYVQFNDGGVFGGDAGLTYAKTTDILTLVGGLKTAKIIAPTDGAAAGGFYKADGTTGAVIIDTSSTPSVKISSPIQVQRNSTGGAFGFSSPYLAFVLGNITGANAPNSAMYAAGRYNRSNHPFNALSVVDNNSQRELYFGGGGWAAPDATRISFWTAPTYTENLNEGALRMHIGADGVGIGHVNASTALTAFLDLAAGAAAKASLRVRHGAAPTTPNDGDVWTTTAGLFVRINGVTKTVTLT